MRNTLALGLILAGSVMILSAFKNWKLLTTLQVVLGMKPWDTPADGGGRNMNGTINGVPTPGATPGSQGTSDAPPGHTWTKAGHDARLQPNDIEGDYRNISNTASTTSTTKDQQTEFTVKSIDGTQLNRHYYSAVETVDRSTGQVVPATQPQPFQPNQSGNGGNRSGVLAGF